MNTAPQATRHHPLLVALHWLTGLMLLLALAMGTWALAPMPLDAQEKVGALKGHMSFGILLGILMLARLAVHVLTVKHVLPTPSSGSVAKDALAKLVHAGLYVLVLAMVASGMATALSSGLAEVVWGGAGGAVPANLRELAPRIAHAWIAKGIALLVALHVAAALMRHVVNRDGTLGRMWFGQR